MPHRQSITPPRQPRRNRRLSGSAHVTNFIFITPASDAAGGASSPGTASSGVPFIRHYGRGVGDIITEPSTRSHGWRHQPSRHASPAMILNLDDASILKPIHCEGGDASAMHGCDDRVGNTSSA